MPPCNHGVRSESGGAVAGDTEVRYQRLQSRTSLIKDVGGRTRPPDLGKARISVAEVLCR
jgi:hypothetical protein